MKVSNSFKLIIAIIISELAGALGSIFTVSSIPNWYAFLQKPALNPPNWVFGPVWTTLYLLMGIAAFLVWTREDASQTQRKNALAVFIFQLVLNTLWSVVFFGMHDPFAALVVIAALWISILATIIIFYKISRPAAYLLIPYITWVSFAAYLNYAVWVLN